MLAHTAAPYGCTPIEIQKAEELIFEARRIASVWQGLTDGRWGSGMLQYNHRLNLPTWSWGLSDKSASTSCSVDLCDGIGAQAYWPLPFSWMMDYPIITPLAWRMVGLLHGQQLTLQKTTAQASASADVILENQWPPRSINSVTKIFMKEWDLPDFSSHESCFENKMSFEHFIEPFFIYSVLNKFLQVIAIDVNGFVALNLGNATAATETDLNCGLSRQHGNLWHLIFISSHQFGELLNGGRKIKRKLWEMNIHCKAIHTASWYLPADAHKYIFLRSY